MKLNGGTTGRPRAATTDPTEDTGSLAADLLVIARAQREMYNDPLAKGLLPLILDSCFRDPITADAFSEQFIHRQRAATVKVPERAIVRGEIQLCAPMLFRAALPGMAPIDEDFERAIVASVLRDLRVANAEDVVAQAVRQLDPMQGGHHGEA
ncbi:TetR-like C-terminal domain-containing protein [Rhodococcus sp. W8901]|uniref:TetR-like C-terminal domain-containing protein n=1 Tax=Rhodococcus sp. W8901 TaxID=2742603 RepID=UPI0015819450|nr:TetR-like C-terminal domain-containing protein [Rhodococcus sp. W8901]QKT13697.1 TetR/AcrR family transcriptional regulator C-terminal ligand-binding domain-containing protein [Rhodococcus sp. W8901]